MPPSLLIWAFPHIWPRLMWHQHMKYPPYTNIFYTFMNYTLVCMARSCVCVRACVRACMRACVRARACVFVYARLFIFLGLLSFPGNSKLTFLRCCPLIKTPKTSGDAITTKTKIKSMDVFYQMFLFLSTGAYGANGLLWSGHRTCALRPITSSCSVTHFRFPSHENMQLYT